MRMHQCACTSWKVVIDIFCLNVKSLALKLTVLSARRAIKTSKLGTWTKQKSSLSTHNQHSCPNLQKARKFWIANSISIIMVNETKLIDAGRYNQAFR